MDPIGSGKCSQAGGENLPSGDTVGGWQRTSQTLNISARHDDELRDKATVKRLNDILKTGGKTGAVKAECEFAKQSPRTLLDCWCRSIQCQFDSEVLTGAPLSAVVLSSLVGRSP